MKDEIQQASKAMAHIHVFAGIVGMLESGVICGGGTADTTSLKIIALCKRENQRQLKIHDRAIEAVHGIKGDQSRKDTDMKHVHHDMIIEWAADTSRVVEIFCISGKWRETSVPSWARHHLYRFKPAESK